MRQTYKMKNDMHYMIRFIAKFPIITPCIEDEAVSPASAKAAAPIAKLVKNAKLPDESCLGIALVVVY